MGDVARIYPPSVRGAVSTHLVATRDVGLALSLAIAVPLLCWGLTNPWVDETGYNGAWMNSCARNTLHYGLAETGLLQVRNDGRAGVATVLALALSIPPKPDLTRAFLTPDHTASAETWTANKRRSRV